MLGSQMTATALDIMVGHQACVATAFSHWDDSSPTLFSIFLQAQSGTKHSQHTLVSPVASGVQWGMHPEAEDGNSEPNLSSKSKNPFLFLLPFLIHTAL